MAQRTLSNGFSFFFLNSNQCSHISSLIFSCNLFSSDCQVRNNNKFRRLEINEREENVNRI